MKKEPIVIFYKIFKLFGSEKHSEDTNQRFWHWLTNEEHIEEKDKALQKVWEELLEEHQGPDADVPFQLECWKQKNGLSGNTSRSASRMADNLSVDVKKTDSSSRNKHLLRWWKSVAAILVLAVGMLVFQLLNGKKETDIVQQYTPVASMDNITLPDGTQVQLNSRSTLLYPEKFTGDSRSVYLVGEANFKVKPDKRHPFIVKNEDFQITALGTEFNVSAYPEDDVIQAVLLSGSVKAEFDGLSQCALLRPEEQVSYHKKKHSYTVSRPDMDDATAWQRSEQVFREKTVLEIISVLKRKYNYEFVYSLNDLKDDRFCFRFRENAPLKEVMEMVTDVAGNLSFEIEGNKCCIVRK